MFHSFRFKISGVSRSPYQVNLLMLEEFADVSHFDLLFSSRVTCQDLPTNKKKQTGHRHPDFTKKPCEIREKHLQVYF